MEQVYSQVDPTLLCHQVIRLNDIQNRHNVSEDNQFLQLATLRMNSGHTFQPHQHIYRPTPVTEIIAQESWVVIQGCVQVMFYDIDGALLHTVVLNAGDASMTFRGGHNYLILKDDTVVYEYKTGPYQGQALDKVFL
jgi:cupin fold WbuC family metalloprotein